MIPTPGHLAGERQKISDRIARQRTELSVAYRGLIKPFQYTETAIAGVNTLRKNGWIISLAPSVVSLIFSFFGWEKKGRPSLLGRLGQKIRGKQARVVEEKETVSKLKMPLSHLGRHAWSLFQVYRKVRPYFP